MEVALVLSKEHHTLPLAEVEAVLDAEGMNYLVKKDKEGLLLLDLPDDHSESLIKITKRLSFTHELFKVLIRTDEHRLIAEAKKYPWNERIKSDFAVRVKKMDKKSSFDSSNLEWEMGRLIKANLDKKAQVNLKNPSLLIRIVLQDGEALIGHRIGEISKKHFFNLKPHKRPFFIRDQ